MRNLCREGRRSGMALVAALALTVAATASHPASAESHSMNIDHPDSNHAYNVTILGAAPFRAPFADNNIHNHVTIESNAADLANWQPRFDGPGGEDNYEPTDLTFSKVLSYKSSVDIY